MLLWILMQLRSFADLCSLSACSKVREFNMIWIDLLYSVISKNG